MIHLSEKLPVTPLDGKRQSCFIHLCVLAPSTSSGPHSRPSVYLKKGFLISFPISKEVYTEKKIFFSFLLDSIVGQYSVTLLSSEKLC